MNLLFLCKVATSFHSSTRQRKYFPARYFLNFQKYLLRIHFIGPWGDEQASRPIPNHDIASGPIRFKLLIIGKVLGKFNQKVFIQATSVILPEGQTLSRGRIGRQRIRKTWVEIELNGLTRGDVSKIHSSPRNNTVGAPKGIANVPSRGCVSPSPPSPTG